MRKPRYEFVFVGIVFLLVDSYFSYGIVTSYLRQLRASQTYVPVAATVVASEIVERGSNRTTHGTSFSPRIVYRYTVEGKEFESHRYFFSGQGWSDRDSAQAVTDQYPVGQRVQAYINPQNPREAVLNPTEPRAGSLVVAGVFLLIALFPIVYGLRGRTEN
ncbi:MAG: DUF3592 domain-containing protein [Deltaproteobacteria bacterium]|nr:DUF3592 domain-containing protein [Deltaproteobacteria bacterium]